MISGDKILLTMAYSIDLYAINLNEKFVPESHALAPSEGSSIVRVAKVCVASINFGPCKGRGSTEKTMVPLLTVEHPRVLPGLKRLAEMVLVGSRDPWLRRWGSILEWW